MPRRRESFNTSIPWGLYFSDAAVGLPTGWTAVTMPFVSIANDVAIHSAQVDLQAHAGLIAPWWRWRCRFRFQSATVVGEFIKLYICGADDTDSSEIDGDFDAAADTTITEADLANCDNFANVNTTQQVDCIQSGLVRIADRYITLGMLNDTAAETFDATSEDSFFKMWPDTTIETP